MKKTILLTNYSIISDPRDTNPYTAPEVKSRVLSGNVKDHPLIQDGEFIYTSPIIRFIDEETVETKNHIYKLQKKSSDYQLFLDQYNSSY